MINFQNILVKVRTLGIKSIILNDPTTYNSLSIKTLKSLLLAIKTLNKDKITKVIIYLNVIKLLKRIVMLFKIGKNYSF